MLQRFQVMKDWSDLEEKYQDIRAHDPVAADAFKRWMTARFQETVAALEESGAAEKHQLSAMHQQRVQVRDLSRIIDAGDEHLERRQSWIDFSSRRTLLYANRNNNYILLLRVF